MLWYLQPHIIFVKGVLVRVEAFEIAVISGTVISPIHGCVLLMTEYNPSAGLTFSRCLAALTAYWFLLITFQLSMTAGQAISYISANTSGLWGLNATYHPVRDLIGLRLATRRALYLDR